MTFFNLHFSLLLLKEFVCLWKRLFSWSFQEKQWRELMGATVVLRCSAKYCWVWALDRFLVSSWISWNLSKSNRKWELFRGPAYLLHFSKWWDMSFSSLLMYYSVFAVEEGNCIAAEEKSETEQITFVKLYFEHLHFWIQPVTTFNELWRKCFEVWIEKVWFFFYLLIFSASSMFQIEFSPHTIGLTSLWNTFFSSDYGGQDLSLTATKSENLWKQLSPMLLV